MKINILLNDLNYRYDIYQMFNIFYSFHEIIFNQDIYGYVINVSHDKVSISHDGKDKTYTDFQGMGIKNYLKKVVFEFLTEETNNHHPWGTLIGIRPSKIAWEMLNKGYEEEKIISYFNEIYLADREKASLCIEVAKNESSFINKDENKISVYIGMPFCPTRCAYCSFASNPIASCKSQVVPYLDALKKEIIAINNYITKHKLTIETVYFGGGTPTSVDEKQFEYIMSVIYENFLLDKNIGEFTVECGRPDSITENKLITMKKYNVNRISINPQTMNDDTLKKIGRNHNSKDIKDIFKIARELNFNNINMDIIVGLPGEGIEEIKHTCSEIKKLKPESITVHGMSIKRGSALHERIILNDKFNIPKQSELNFMYGETRNLSKELNMIPYYMYRQKNMVGNMENVGYTIKGKECIYNIEMIEEKQTIIALGADGISKVVFKEENRIERFANLKDIRQYTENIDKMIEGKIKLLDSLYSHI
ncbi:coproporphyrinogen III oxidase, anaerobic [Clostridium amylolyticum]|uniref:Coproporphyrinogen III oxidase, anaerobic n=1 Tax=Clostridium amylolyticum TaxID=1121298 RepID=A0A1M6CW76_9CLOT|nr:coproporphyrinogen III oxidase [Clostridium amylolyticum]SHI65325.1 coproporphyrinogen III oxidase, anaerobic [Clostridium amylolyticum]